MRSTIQCYISGVNNVLMNMDENTREGKDDISETLPKGFFLEFPYFRVLWGVWLVVSPFISIPLFIASFLILIACVSFGMFED